MRLENIAYAVLSQNRFAKRIVFIVGSPQKPRSEVGHKAMTTHEDAAIIPGANVKDIDFESAFELSNTVSDTSAFTIFPNLPQELRLKIWRATFESRKITIRVESDGWISPGALFKYPVALYICSESRQEALQWYRLLFGDSRYPQYFNPLIDIPHIRHGSVGSRRVNIPSPLFSFSSTFLVNLRKLLDSDFMSCLRHLAIDRDLWVLRMGSAPLLMGMFGQLEKLFIVIDDTFLRDEDEWVDIEDVDEDMHDVIRFMGALDPHRKPPDRYHLVEEKFQYIHQRMKLKTAEWDHCRFAETRESLIYAAYVKEDVLEKLNEGAEPGTHRNIPQVQVVIETNVSE